MLVLSPGNVFSRRSKTGYSRDSRYRLHGEGSGSERASIPIDLRKTDPEKNEISESAAGWHRTSPEVESMGRY